MVIITSIGRMPEHISPPLLYVTMNLLVQIARDIRCHNSDVSLGMSAIQNGGSHLMYYRTSVKLVKWSRTGTNKPWVGLFQDVK